MSSPTTPTPATARTLIPSRWTPGHTGWIQPSKLRELVRNYPGIRKGIPFWDDEFNSIPSWTGSDESVQAKYVTRGMLYNWAAGVKTFVWLLTAGTDGNEYDDFGLVHGLRYLPDDFTPRPVYAAYQNLNALFSDTQLDPEIQIQSSEIPALRRQIGRSVSGARLPYGIRESHHRLLGGCTQHSRKCLPAARCHADPYEFRHHAPGAHRRGVG